MTGGGDITGPTMSAMSGLFKTGRQGMKHPREMAAGAPEDDPGPAGWQAGQENTAPLKR